MWYLSLADINTMQSSIVRLDCEPIIEGSLIKTYCKGKLTYFNMLACFSAAIFEGDAEYDAQYDQELKESEALRDSFQEMLKGFSDDDTKLN